MARQRILSSSIALLLLLATVDIAYHAISSRRNTPAASRPGKLVVAGKLRLKLYCSGIGHPTVVLESGLADSLEEWVKVQPQIARFTRVCSYDRAGYGESDPAPMPRTSDRIAAELHAALISAGEKPPYLLVGHSFGGFNVRVFNGKYSNQVAGLVLVDATQEDQYRLLPKAWSSLSAATLRRAKRQVFLAPFYLELIRLQLWFRAQPIPAMLLQSKYLEARTSELENIQCSAEQARRADRIDEKPLIVLTAGRVIDAGLKAALHQKDQIAYEQTWINDLQLRLAHLSRRSRRILVLNSGHDMPSDRPDAIVSAVRELSNVQNMP